MNTSFKHGKQTSRFTMVIPLSFGKGGLLALPTEVVRVVCRFAISKETRLCFHYLPLLILLLFTATTLTAQSNIITALKSAAVPGWGELSQGNNTGYIFITTEVLFWTTYFTLNDQSTLYQRQAKQFAFNHANMSSYNMPEDIWLHMERFTNSGFGPGGYNDYIRRIAYDSFPNSMPWGVEAAEYLRDQYLRENLLPDDISWDWGTDEQRYRYRKYRNDSMRFKDFAKAATGAILANHILSFLNTLRIVAPKAQTENNLMLYTDFDTQLTPYLHIDYRF